MTAKQLTYLIISVISLFYAIACVMIAPAYNGIEYIATILTGGICGFCTGFFLRKAFTKK